MLLATESVHLVVNPLIHNSEPGGVSFGMLLHIFLQLFERDVFPVFYFIFVGLRLLICHRQKYLIVFILSQFIVYAGFVNKMKHRGEPACHTHFLVQASVGCVDIAFTFVGMRAAGIGP